MTNNIAEGHGRFSYQENIQFVRQSRGSLEELIDDLNICHDEKYFEDDFLNDLKSKVYEILKKLNGYISYLRNQKEKQNQK